MLGGFRIHFQRINAALHTYVGCNPIGRVDPLGLQLVNRSAAPVLVKAEEDKDGFIWVWCDETYAGKIDGVKPSANHFQGDWWKVSFGANVTIKKDGTPSPNKPDFGDAHDRLPGRKKETDFSDRIWNWKFPPVDAGGRPDPSRPIYQQKDGVLKKLN